MIILNRYFEVVNFGEITQLKLKKKKHINEHKVKVLCVRAYGRAIEWTQPSQGTYLVAEKNTHDGIKRYKIKQKGQAVSPFYF